MGMLEAKVVAFKAALTLKVDSSCTTCGPLMQQSDQTMTEVFKLAALEVNDVATIKMCLGSVAQPHQFPPDPETMIAKHVPSQNKGKKGGCLTEVSEMLQTRRPTMEAEQYFPPPQFDAQRLGCVTRRDSKLRALIVQEVSARRTRVARTRSALSHSLPPPQIEEVCGDLYPSKKEREVILSAIQAFCGPPEISKVAGETAYFDNWKGADMRKHKGASVADLERARINPAKYGVTGKADHRGQRPPRPPRVPAPVSANIAVAANIPEDEILMPQLHALHAGGQLQQQAPQPPLGPTLLPAEMTTETGPAVAAVEPGEAPAMGAMGEDEEATVLRQIQEQEAAVTAVLEKEKAKKEAAAKARKLKAAEAKAAKDKAKVVYSYGK